MKKALKKITFVAVLLVVVACANTNNNYAEATQYADNYEYTNSGDFFYGGWQ